jgi:hypothetical protein
MIESHAILSSPSPFFSFVLTFFPFAIFVDRTFLLLPEVWPLPSTLAFPNRWWLRLLLFVVILPSVWLPQLTMALLRLLPFLSFHREEVRLLPPIYHRILRLLPFSLFLPEVRLLPLILAFGRLLPFPLAVLLLLPLLVILLEVWLLAFLRLLPWLVIPLEVRLVSLILFRQLRR